MIGRLFGGSSKQQVAMQAGQQYAAAGGALPGGNQFQFFPVQVGGPTPYAKSRRYVFMGVVVYQLLMCIMAFVEFLNFLSGMVMMFAIFSAALAVKEDMNITYICWFGVLSFVGFVCGMVSAFIGFAIKISTIVIKFNIPLSCFFGMVVAWMIFSDYETEHPESNDMVGSWLRAFGLLKAKVAPAPAGISSATLLSAGQLPQFGDMKAEAQSGYAAAMPQAMGYRDAAMQQAGQYGAMGQEKMGAYGAMGQEKMGAYGDKAAGAQEAGMAGAGGLLGSVSNWGSTMGPSVPVPQGQADVRRDPFMTQ